MADLFFILVDRQPKAVNVFRWGRWFARMANRRVAETLIRPGLRVSTVFLGIDHRLAGDGPPLLFETLVFDDDGEVDECRRYATWDEAEAGHRALCRWLLTA